MADYNPQVPPQPQGAGMAQPPPQQPVYQQPVQPVQPVYMQPVVVSDQPEPPRDAEDVVTEDRLQLRVYSHSNLFYWWPVWVVGFLMAFLSYWQGVQSQIGNNAAEWYHPSNNIGILFFVTLYLVILITNVSVRGLASGMVVMGVVLVTVLFAYFGWWDDILLWAGNLSVHLNMGAYLAFATLMFLTWALAVFVFDRMSYWLIKPGQITHVFVFGTGSRSYDTNNIMLEKHRDDLFRHWILGLGSGDIQIQTAGASQDRLFVPNVLFVGRKIEIIQHMIATQPDKFGHVVLK